MKTLTAIVLYVCLSVCLTMTVFAEERGPGLPPVPHAESSQEFSDLEWTPSQFLMLDSGMCVVIFMAEKDGRKYQKTLAGEEVTIVDVTEDK